MGPEGIILINPPITTFQQSLTHSALLFYVKADNIVKHCCCYMLKRITGNLLVAGGLTQWWREAKLF